MAETKLRTFCAHPARKTPLRCVRLDKAGPGCLLVLNRKGKLVQTISGGPINGPWDMTLADHGFFATLYVTNVENGPVATSATPVDQGTVVRLQLLTIPGFKPFAFDEDVIATGFPELARSTAVRARGNRCRAVE
jgi:hypothetical protein